MYALTQAHDWAGRNDSSDLQAEIVDNLFRAAGYLVKRIDDVPGMQGAKAVWSPANERDDVPTTKGRAAKLGGTGLGLVAFCRLEMMRSGTVPMGLLEQMGDFVLSLILPNGACISKLDEHGQPTLFLSYYYPGEAALGLSDLFKSISKNEMAECRLCHPSEFSQNAGSEPGEIFLITGHY